MTSRRRIISVGLVVNDALMMPNRNVMSSGTASFVNCCPPSRGVLHAYCLFTSLPCLALSLGIQWGSSQPIQIVIVLLQQRASSIRNEKSSRVFAAIYARGSHPDTC